MTPIVRRGSRADLEPLIGLLQQLSLVEPREDPGALAAYERAFEAIEADPRQTLLVCEVEGAVAGTAAIVVVPNLSHAGRPYAVVENVVVDSACRGRGYGEALMRRGIELAREAGCYKVVLASNRGRADAHRFYERLGFTASHYGFRMDL